MQWQSRSQTTIIKAMETLLHVERSSVVRNIVRQIARDRGVAYFEADTVEQGMSILEQEPVDLIISGLELGDGRGVDLIEQANAEGFRDLPVLIVTGEDSLEVRERMFSLGVVDYILKQDVRSGVLEQHLDRFLRPDDVITALQQARIAILDDSEVVQRVIRRTLAAFGIEKIDSYLKPHELLASENPYELYLIDVVLPQLSGPEVIGRIRDRNPAAVIVAVSSIDNTRTVASVLQAGADDYITKPFDSFLFAARLRAAYRPRLLGIELERKNRRLKEMARHDSLTSALNHGESYRILDRLLESGTDVSVAVIDVDDFKTVNDTHGHGLGDGLLTALVSHAREVFGAHTSIGRIGGDEFIVIAPGTSGAELARQADSFVQAFASDTSIGVSARVSVGIAERTGNDGDAAALVEAADKAMYVAKQDGGNRSSY